MTELVNGAVPAATPVEATTDGNRVREALDESTPEPSAAAPADAADKSALKRAEELEDVIAARVAAVSSAWARTAMQLAAHVREAAEDVWAEAQTIRRGERMKEEG